MSPPTHWDDSPEEEAAVKHAFVDLSPGLSWNKFQNKHITGLRLLLMRCPIQETGVAVLHQRVEPEGSWTHSLVQQVTSLWEPPASIACTDHIVGGHPKPVPRAVTLNLAAPLDWGICLSFLGASLYQLIICTPHHQKNKTTTLHTQHPGSQAESR